MVLKTNNYIMLKLSALSKPYSKPRDKFSYISVRPKQFYLYIKPSIK